MTKRVVVHEDGNVLEVPVFSGTSSGHTYLQFANSSNVGTVRLGGQSSGAVNLYDSSTNLRMSLGANVSGEAQINGWDASGTNTFTINSSGIFSGPVSCQYLTSTVSTGTAPFFVSSSTVVTNLNADQVDGQHGSYYLSRSNHTGSQTASTISDFSEAVDDRVYALFSSNPGSILTYSDVSNSFLISVSAATLPTTASGNLTSTTLDSALAELQADIDTRATATKGSVAFFRAVQPNSSYATTDIRTGASSPTEAALVYDFDASSIEYIDYMCRLSGYQGGGLTFTIPWSATSATSGTTRWGIAIRRLAAGSDDLDVSHTYDFNDVDSTAPSTNGSLAYATIAFTHGSDMDDWAEGEVAIVRVRRNASHANDNMTGDAELHGLYAKET